MDNHLIRKQLKNKRQILTLNEVQELSFLIQQTIINDPKLNQLKNIGLYVSKGNEVNTIDLIKYFLKQNAHIYVPRVAGKEMDFYLIESLDDLKLGTYTILEPKEKCLKLNQPLDVLYVPLVGFDHKMNRLGMGGGYYDRYLAKHPIKRKIGLAYHFQECQFEVFYHDQPLDEIITDKKRIVSHF